MTALGAFFLSFVFFLVVRKDKAIKVGFPFNLVVVGVVSLLVYQLSGSAQVTIGVAATLLIIVR